MARSAGGTVVKPLEADTDIEYSLYSNDTGMTFMSVSRIKNDSIDYMEFSVEDLKEMLKILEEANNA